MHRKIKHGIPNVDFFSSPNLLMTGAEYYGNKGCWAVKHLSDFCGSTYSKEIIEFQKFI